MLRIYSFIIETLRLLEPTLREIARHDFDLARQGRRAAASIALDTAEGYGNMDGNRRSPSYPSPPASSARPFALCDHGRAGPSHHWWPRLYGLPHENTVSGGRGPGHGPGPGPGPGPGHVA
jgi:hypothetical protein